MMKTLSVLLLLATSLGGAHADTVVPGDKRPAGDQRDRDGDGIPDAIDMCPDDPEDRDGYQDYDGCPDPDNDRDPVPIGHGDPIRFRFNIDDKVYFPSGSARLKGVAAPILDGVVRTLNENPQLKRIEIQGHTDGREAPSLGLERALVVERYLIAHGVDSERLVAHGYGARRPVDHARTELSRGRNRRAEFYVDSSDGPPQD
jgi:outer membrane protein OmpA-like peptidoglycan-associated protein